MEQIKRIIRLNDTFKTNLDVINLVYNLHNKSCQTSVYKRLWFPYIGGRKDWYNTRNAYAWKLVKTELVIPVTDK